MYARSLMSLACINIYYYEPLRSFVLSQGRREKGMGYSKQYWS